MSAAVLSELFVDVSARGLDSTKGKVDSFSKGIEATAGGWQALAGTIQSVLTKALIPVAGLTAGLYAMAAAGFAGTTQLSNLGYKFQMLNRQVAAAFMPIVEGLTNVLGRVARAWESLGMNGQRAILALTIGLTGLTATLGLFIAGFTPALAFAPLIAMIGVLVGGFPEVRAAIWQVVEAVKEVGVAAWPIIKMILIMGVAFIQTFAVKPLVAFLNVLTLILHTIGKIIDKLVSMSAFLTGIRDLDISGGAGNRVTAGTTGVESSRQTYERIQEAAFKTDKGETGLDKNTFALQRLSDKIDAWINAIRSPRDLIPDTKDIVGGSVNLWDAAKNKAVNYGLSLLGGS